MSPKIFIHAVTEHAHHEDKMNVITILCDTLRRDHCGPYNHGQPLNQCWSREAPDWIVPTLNMDRLAARGTVFENAWCGSTPCMPARRDMHTGRFEFLERGWGPLEEEDLDLARQISGPANQSITGMLEKGHNVSQLITDHFHLWEQGSGNYHMGFTGFEFVRGVEGDCFRTDPVEFKCPPKELLRKNERHWRNVHFIRKSEEDWFCAQVFSKAATWLDRNHTHDGFYLHLDCFDPHEPWDPPQELVDEFFPGAYDVEGWTGAGPYAKWRNVISEDLFKSYRARYAANVVLVDRWLGRLLDKRGRAYSVYRVPPGTWARGASQPVSAVGRHVHDHSLRNGQIDTRRPARSGPDTGAQGSIRFYTGFCDCRTVWKKRHYHRR
jgi:arylsulfatase A-like enzyme